MTQLARAIGRTAAIALCYFALGKLGLAVALPPGYVSAIWPAAGFAFAATVLWGIPGTWVGVLIGASLTNATVGGGFQLNAVAVGIAAGSTLQAAIGGSLLKQLMPNFELNAPAKVLRFLLVGLFSCLVASFCGNLVLLANGFIAWPQVPQSFVTWWFGDAFGVQIFAPVTLMVVAPDAMWKQRRLSVGAPLLVAFLLSGAVYYFVRDSDERQLRRSFAASTARFDSDLRDLDADVARALRQLASSYSVRDEVPGAEFVPLATEVYESLGKLRAVSWAPVLDTKAQALYLTQVRPNGPYAPLRFPPGAQRDAEGLVAPVAIIYPEKDNEVAMGTDALSEPRRALALHSALASGQLTVTTPLQLMQDPKGPGAVLLMAPVKNRVTQGVVSGVLDLRVIGKALQDLPGTVWELREVSATGEKSLWKSDKVDMPAFTEATYLDRLGVYSQQNLALGGRNWHILLHRPHKYLVNETGDSPLLVLMLSLFACGLVTNFLLIRSGEHERIAAEVLAKTAALQAEVVERRGVQVALEESKLAAEGANLAKSRFLATMSHEIRTPMNGILGMAQLLLMPNVTEGQRSDYVRTILTSGQTLLTLLNDILDLSKIEAGKFQLDSTTFQPIAILREASTLFAGAAKAKELRLDFDWQGPDNQRYQSDSHRIRQMLSNLVGNAIKFTAFGRVHMQAVELERDAQTALLEFSVSDTGLGIAADKMDLLFKPFSQTDSSTTREYGGSGLGLSIVLNLARALGGDTGVESTPGAGSRFWFTVRVQWVAIGTQSRAVQRPKPEAPGQALRGQVLVAEDNAVNRMVIQSLLGQLGVAVTVVNDGQQAVDYLAQADPAKYPDLLLMDLHMPVLDGYGATQQIRQWEQANTKTRLTIIALTADAYDEDRQRCFAAGMDDFLTKPIAIDALRQALAQWLPKATAAVPTAVPGAAPNSLPLTQLQQQQFAALAQEIIPLLQHSKFNALAKMEELQDLARTSPLESDVEELAEILKTFRFDLALLRLQRILATQAN